MLCSIAYRHAAAGIPPCRSAPPNSFRARRARVMSFFDPIRIDPIGHPSPFEKQIDTVSNGSASSFGEYPRALQALKNRAPSRWNFSPFDRAHSPTRSTCASG